MYSAKLQYINLATDEANKSTLKCRHGAVLVKGGKVLSKGYNRDNIHAECMAIKNGYKYWNKNVDLYIVRISDNNLLMSKPCMKCVEKIRKTKINRIYYSNLDGKTICEKSYNLHSNHISKGMRFYT